MNEIQPTTMKPFLYKDRTEVRTVQDDQDQTWWALLDVCEALGIKNSQQVRASLKDKHVRNVRLAGNNNLTTVMAEPALYRLILRSNRPEAEPFQDWVFEEVLPAIRRTGMYLTDEVRELNTERRTTLAYQCRSLRRTADRYPAAASAILHDVRDIEDNHLYGWMESVATPDSNRRIREIAPPNT